MSLSSLMLPLLLAAPAGDPVVVVRADLAGVEHPLFVKAYEPAGTHPSSLGSAVASDTTFGKALGKKPVLFVFPADVQGDGTDEIVQVRLRPLKKGALLDLQARAFLPPPVLGGQAVKVAVTKKKTLGGFDGEGAVFLVAAADIDGDGRDEALVARAWSDGRQSLEVRRFPKKKHKPMKPPIADDATFGQVLDDANVALCGADVDGDGDEEIVAVRRSSGAPDRLLVFEPPTELGGETGEPVRSDLDVTQGNGFVVGVGRMDVEGDGVDEIAVLSSVPLQGVRLDVYTPPPGPDTDLGAPLFSVPDLAPAAGSEAVLAVFGLEGYVAVPPPLPDDLSGTWDASFSHTVNGAPESFQLLGLQAVTGGGSFQILMPTFHPWVGAYSPEQGEIDFGSATHPVDLPQAGASYQLQLQPAQVTLDEGELRITISYTGVKDLPGGNDPQVTGGTLVLVRRDG